FHLPRLALLLSTGPQRRPRRRQGRLPPPPRLPPGAPCAAPRLITRDANYPPPPPRAPRHGRCPPPQDPLSTASSDSSTSELRVMAAVLLRKLLSPDDLFQLWPLLSPDGQAALKSNLVNASGSAAATLTELAAAAHSYLHRAGV
uniref:Uncharacterized protein n=2 Tax=Aegilops tauschii subsp. strangulata TaxID=200361 RepID=A0A453F610_AEGTS